MRALDAIVPRRGGEQVTGMTIYTLSELRFTPEEVLERRLRGLSCRGCDPNSWDRGDGHVLAGR